MKFPAQMSLVEKKKSVVEEKSAAAAIQRRKSGSLFYVLRHCMNSDLPIAEPD